MPTLALVIDVIVKAKAPTKNGFSRRVLNAHFICFISGNQGS
jgi:hypothetical protein